jgi:hypothetical protein
MKRWFAITAGIGLQVAQLVTPVFIKDDNLKQAAQAAIVALTGYVVKKTSETNPDGTPAQIPWEKKRK